MYTKKSTLFILLFIIITAVLLSSCTLKKASTKVNNLTANDSKITKKIITHEPAPFNKTYVSPRLSESNDYINYIVNKGDTLCSICRKYQDFCPERMAVKTVIALNNLTQADELKEGMTIELPDQYFISGIKYTVKTGDTLFRIVKKHMPNEDINKAIEIIMKDNFMSSSEVNAGDEIFIENGK